MRGHAHHEREGARRYLAVVLRTDGSSKSAPSSWSRGFAAGFPRLTLPPRPLWVLFPIMTRITTAIAAVAALFALQTIGSPATPPPPPSSSVPASPCLKCDAASFAAFLPPDAMVESITSIPDNGSFGEAGNIAYPWFPTSLPALCSVTVRVVTSPSSYYRFGLFLPTVWTGRFLGVGNGGFTGGINWIDMAPGPHFGAAAMSTDTGHNGSNLDVAWATNQPERKTDWGWRAMHGSTVLGKQLTSAYYGKPISHSYYSGCSTGGRQGLKEVQNSPDSYDGVLVGAPAWWLTHLLNWVTKVGMYNLPSTDPKHIPLTLAPALAAEVQRQCDGADGLIDGIVSDPEACDLDFDKLLCGNQTNETAICLSPPQVQTAKKVYSDYHSSVDGKLIYPGLTLSSEEQWWIVLGGSTEPSPFGVAWQRDMLFNDPHWDWRTYNDSVVAEADAIDPGQANADDFAAVKAFKARGGKMILYHGLADGLVPTKGSQMYYNNTIQAFNGSLDNVTDFFRLFLVPGMQHCWLTSCGSPWNFGGSTHAGAMGMSEWSVPGFRDQKHDALLALIDWVENGNPVDQIVATAWKELQNPASGVWRQRPLCAWPATAKHDGKGDPDVANSWACV